MTQEMNRADLSTELRAYIQSLHDALGSRDPFEVLRETPEVLRAAVEGVRRERLVRPEGEGKWSALEVIQHLADSDLVGAFRFRMILAHDRPQLPGYDQELWATRLRYNDGDPSTVLEEFVMLRRANLRLLQRVTPQELKRVMTHSERGEESIETMIPMYAGHDVIHIRQIARILGSQ